MDHIFGDSHDIAFGGTKSNPPPTGKTRNSTSHAPESQSSTREYAPRKSDQSSQRRNDAPPKRNFGGMYDRGTTPKPLPNFDEVPPLTRLIQGMKSSFFPKEDDAAVVQMVPLSSAAHEDPLFLIKKDDESLLIGSGFDTITRAGKTYPTFPDMRLVFSEKDNITAWILTNENIEITPFLTLLPSLGFPPIYTSRSIIAKFRESITDPTFLEKCRFFEFFSWGSSERRIGSFEFSSRGTMGWSSCISFRASATIAGFGYIPVLGNSIDILPEEQIIRKHGESFHLWDSSFQAGEILLFRGKTLTKHSLKFTFDTFYLDAQSVGVVAGYTLSDREMLAMNGVLTFTLEEDMRARTIAGHIFIDSRGFVHAHEMMAVHKEILKWIRATYEKLILENERIERGELVQSLRREITKYCYLLTGRTPVVMPIVIER
jgi:hypothetical protein